MWILAALTSKRGGFAHTGLEQVECIVSVPDIEIRSSKKS